MASRQASVVLFDIPGIVKQKGWSLNILRTRYLLNYKKIPHTTRWVEYPDIKPLFIELGIPPTGKNSQGEDSYTCPAIQYSPADGSKPVFVADSWAIAAFLEKHHPEPPAFTNGNLEEQTDLGGNLRDALLIPLVEALIRNSYGALNEASRPYFRQTREKAFGKKIEELCPDREGLDAALGNAKSKFDEFVKKFDNNSGLYLYGKDINYLDMVTASIFMWMKLVAHKDLWSQAQEWDGGRWKRLLDDFEEKGYATVY